MKIKINNHQLNVVESGNKAGPAVVMGHSLACSHMMWDPQMPVLEDDYRVVRIDMRGHGASDAVAGPYSLDDLADDVIGVMDALDIKRAHWVGLSIGGMYGQNLLLRYANRFDSAVLADTMSQMPDAAQSMWDERIKMVTENGMDAVVDATMERWFTEEYRAAAAPGLAAIREQILSTSVEGFVGCCHAIRGLNNLERLPEIEHPVSVIVGEQDMGTPVSANEAIHDRIGGSELTIIENAAHISNVEQAKIFNDTLMTFLNSQSS